MPPIHNFSRSRRASLAALAASVAAPAVWAQQDRPIRIIVGFAPGSANDLIARDLARHMAESLKQPVIVENKPGAGGSLGTEAVAKAAPDGLTIGLGTSSQMVMNVALYQNLPFDVERDLRQIGLVGRTPLVLVGKAAGARTLKELIANARANPGQLSYGSGGIGSISHIVGEAFARAADIRLNHVPYKGNGPAMADLAGGHVDMVFDGIITAQPMAQQGRVRLLAFGGKQRNAAIPDVPTFAEQGLRDYDAYTWNCLFAPAKVADADITRLNQALNAALALPAMKERLARGGADNLGPSTPAQADAFGRKERERWVPFVRSLKLAIN
ncbi:MAG TPA: tripartite tricarboxylate transporter substrate binding protein [Ottowia sp.]|nr:tripartite tricarboxylate transporter substrate binding protein [Burkholderiales bacterium]HNE59492.1 tripartite tricarboxylate transporter substrate binding protein [Ottowia sp.]HNI84209.1 tripartite tricarboxylate transporter substrate binding protein [Ottowia sp.]HNJ46616.1 tripartite tricarboxylate transporter substrate binding protein [Ottowia sp.]HNL42567.1 tripartite tricarboxylate transporter substrate binding protein [Ottowia sp.]